MLGTAYRLGGMSVLLVGAIVFSGWFVGDVCSFDRGGTEVCSFGRDADLGFYSAAAQVIPVFFIALVVELANHFRDYPSVIKLLHDAEAKFEANASTESARALLAEIRHDRQRIEDMGGETEGAYTERLENLERRASETVERAEAQDEVLGTQRDMVVGISENLRGMVVATFAVAALGEVASLYALGVNNSTTFLLVVTATSIATMLFLLGAIVLARYWV